MGKDMGAQTGFENLEFVDLLSSVSKQTRDKYKYCIFPHITCRDLSYYDTAYFKKTVQNQHHVDDPSGRG